MADSSRAAPDRRATLADVAARAGVSVPLVSIVMRDAPGASPANRERVRRAAEELGYRPDSRARMLRRTRSRLIGVVFGVQHAFHGDLVSGLYTAADAAGYELALSAVTPARDERRAVTSLLHDRCEALILLGPHLPTSYLSDLAATMPVVVVARAVRHHAVDVVRTDDAAGLGEAVDHLVDLGHRRIAHIDGGRAPGAAERRRGYRAALQRHGLADTAQILPGGLTEDDGATAAEALLDTTIRPTAVTVFNDRCATGVLDVLWRPRFQWAGGAPATPHRRRVPSARRTPSLRANLLRTRRGHARLPALDACNAVLCERARGAQRPRAHAQRRAEIHDGLRVLRDALARRAFVRERPQLLSTALARKSFDAEIARQHALDVAIENRMSLPHATARGSRRRSSGRCRAAPHCFERARKLAAVLGDDQLRGAVQIARTRVVAEPGPQVQHFIDRGSSERAHVRKALHEALVVRLTVATCVCCSMISDTHTRYGVGSLLPRQVFAARAIEPREQRAATGGASLATHVTRVWLKSFTNDGASSTMRRAVRVR